MSVIHISEWIENGSPKGEWFYIVRQERLSDVNKHSSPLLASLILKCLASYGKFETREHRPFILVDNYCSFEFEKYSFNLFVDVNDNSETALFVGIEAQIVEDIS